MTPGTLRGKNVTVVGAARSGVAAARLLHAQGARVFVTDSGQIEPAFRRALRAEGIAFEEGGHSDRAARADFLATSPGVPSSIPLLRQAFAAGAPVYSEIEVASWFCRAPVIAVTGTNGKTTTVLLLGHLFRQAGKKVFVGGNTGYPFSNFAEAAGPSDLVALEVSSFQLDHIATFRPWIAVMLNLAPDHMDRYDQDFDAYARSKFRITENQGPGDWFVCNRDDGEVRARASALRAAREKEPALLEYSRMGAVAEGAFAQDGEIALRITDEKILMRSDELSLTGPHNLHNALAATVAARVAGLSPAVLREGLRTFAGVPHRMELIRETGGVRYVNDSKATNVHAVRYALESMDVPVVLIAGGRDKGNDYAPLKQLVKQKVRAVVAVGESAGKVVRELGSEAAFAMVAGSFEEAVRRARLCAKVGDVVLLSPACASFDMFRNYEERGDAFRHLVNAL